MIWSEFAGLQSRGNNSPRISRIHADQPIMPNPRESVGIRGPATLRLCPGDDHGYCGGMGLPRQARTCSATSSASIACSRCLREREYGVLFTLAYFSVGWSPGNLTAQPSACPRTRSGGGFRRRRTLIPCNRIRPQRWSIGRVKRDSYM